MIDVGGQGCDFVTVRTVSIHAAFRRQGFRAVIGDGYRDLCSVVVEEHGGFEQVVRVAGSVIGDIGQCARSSSSPTSGGPAPPVMSGARRWLPSSRPLPCAGVDDLYQVDVAGRCEQRTIKPRNAFGAAHVADLVRPRHYGRVGHMQQNFVNHHHEDKTAIVRETVTRVVASNANRTRTCRGRRRIERSHRLMETARREHNPAPTHH